MKSLEFSADGCFNSHPTRYVQRKPCVVKGTQDVIDYPDGSDRRRRGTLKHIANTALTTI